jgi:hypothetical protein
MQITGLSLEDFEWVTSLVNRHYGDNLVVHRDGHDTKRGCTARLAVNDSRGRGARRAASGRRGPYACWHAYRDVLKALFLLYPHATVSTGLARYRHQEGFRELYPRTASMNIGSMVQPRYMPDLCECSDIESLDWDLLIPQVRVRPEYAA